MPPCAPFHPSRCWKRWRRVSDAPFHQHEQRKSLVLAAPRRYSRKQSVVHLRRHWFPKAYSDRVAKLRIGAGFIMLVAFAAFSRPMPRSLALGLPISLVGLALRAWAAGHLAKDQRLAVSGPYAMTRNPLY